MGRIIFNLLEDLWLTQGLKIDSSDSNETHRIHSNSNVKQMTDCNDSINVSSNKNNTWGSTQSQYWVLLTIQFLSQKSSFPTESGRNMSIYRSSLSFYFRFRTSNSDFRTTYIIIGHFCVINVVAACLCGFLLLHRNS